ncbi:MAG: DUF177 domain-containing protein [Propionibacteriaceae bacterium]|jgi:uncharacterized protein|nr:DUF177 domain-containing protein [Propionibacteriaceae bacterium]
MIDLQAGGAFRLLVYKFSRQPGSTKHIDRDALAPEDWGQELIKLPRGGLIVLDLTLEAVGEGILVTGTADCTLEGQCARCLTPFERPTEVTFQELFVYEGHAADDEDVSRVVAEIIDLEPVVRDAIVLDLPLAPLCEENCAGLCAECGANLNEEPDHSHGEKADARWAGLSDWVPSQSGE